MQKKVFGETACHILATQTKVKNYLQISLLLFTH